MRRLLPALLLIALVAAAAIFLADRPGDVSVVWLGWEIRTSLGVAVLALVILVGLLWLLLSAAIGLYRTPRRLAARRRERLRLDGYRALTSGLVAVAAGDGAEAARLHHRAETLFRKGQLPAPPLTRLLAAQSALMRGDTPGAHGEFAAMLDNPETEFLGLRGLIVEALRDGDHARALQLTERANRLRPSTPWVLQSQLAVDVRMRDWRKASQSVTAAMRRGALAPGQGRDYRRAILVARAEQAQAGGQAREALKLAAQAHALDEGFGPTAVFYAERLHAEGKLGKARRVLELAWRHRSDPAVATAYDRLLATDSPAQRLRGFERLVDIRPDDPASHIAAAAVALNARLWGEARRHLDQAGANGPGPWSARLCQLAAELEQGERNDLAAARQWLERAAHAPAGPVWFCESCGAETAGWHALCPHCHSLDSLKRRLAPASATGEAALAEPASGEILPPLNVASATGDTLDPTAPNRGAAAPHPVASA